MELVKGDPSYLAPTAGKVEGDGTRYPINGQERTGERPQHSLTRILNADDEGFSRTQSIAVSADDSNVDVVNLLFSKGASGGTL
ncbi:hypothetical protein HDU76_007061 [Blyttiomyces sp. JEL0837]|nr:hypothetical protein HDU76_007061 [Blyttiomyces sp. JEL0837]